MLDRRHWPPALTDLARALMEAAPDVPVRRVRVDEYDGMYELTLQVPRSLLEVAKAKRNA